MLRTKIAILPVLALVVALAITAGVVAIVFVHLYLTSSGTYSGTEHSLYIALTITSTGTATFITNQIRELLLKQIDRGIADSVNGIRASQDFENLNKRWQTILGIENIFTKVRHPQIAIIYLVTGLITTALVASLSPIATVRQYAFLSTLPLGPNRCVDGWLLEKPAHVAYWWPPLPGSEYGYFMYAALDDCPTRDAVTLMGNININDPSIFAYADKGVAVHSTAVGVPLSVYSPADSGLDDGLGPLVQFYGSSIVNTTQCAPVMITNPISCHKGGSIVPIGSSSARIYSDDGLCNATADFNVADPFSDRSGGSMAKAVCMHGNVGQGTIVMGAFWHYAEYIALSMGDSDWEPNETDSTYTVTCSLDTTTVFDYRTVTFSQQSSSIITESGYAKSLVGGEPCTPDTPTIGLVQFATSAAANWAPLKEGQMLDGLSDSILQVSVRNVTALLGREPPWAFNNSANALEDVLGLTAALVVSRINSTTVAVDASAVVTARRIGTGSLYALAFSLPSAIAAVVLLSLLRFAFTASNLPATSSSMISLIRLGRTHELAAPEYALNLLHSRQDWED